MPGHRLQVIQNLLRGLPRSEQRGDHNALHFLRVAEPQAERPIPAQAEGHNGDDEEIAKGRLILYSSVK